MYLYMLCYLGSCFLMVHTLTCTVTKSHRFSLFSVSSHFLTFIKVTVYSLLMNYSYETVIAIGLKVYYWHKFQ